MTSTALRLGPRAHLERWAGILPFVILLAAWQLSWMLADSPGYKLPSIERVVSRGVDMIVDGSLFNHVWHSLLRLAWAFLLGNALAIPLGFAIALNRHVADMFRPILTFFQSIAGIAWVPLAIIWFGVGAGPVIFVIANTVFFSSIYNTVAGVESIPRVLRRAVRCHGGSGWQIYSELIIPGALIQILLGLRTSVAFGLRAMVGAELIAGTNGIGFLIMDASSVFQTDVVIFGMVVIALVWLALDRLLFRQIEKRTVVKWGLLTR
jgi:ABC-type nitrate/sulfonate/bicarbonate transport system permease component